MTVQCGGADLEESDSFDAYAERCRSERDSVQIRLSLPAGKESGSRFEVV